MGRRKGFVNATGSLEAFAGVETVNRLDEWRRKTGPLNELVHAKNRRVQDRRRPTSKNTPGARCLDRYGRSPIHD